MRVMTSTRMLVAALLAAAAHGYHVRPAAPGPLRGAPAVMRGGERPAALDRRSWAAGVGAMAAAGSLAGGPRAANADATVDASAVRSTKGGAKYVVVKEGACPKADFTGLLGSCEPRTGSICIIDYTGFLPNGQVFDSTEKKGGKPLAFKLGSKQVIVGLEQVVSQMLPGEEVQALIPSALVSGGWGAGVWCRSRVVPFARVPFDSFHPPLPGVRREGRVHRRRRVPHRPQHKLEVLHQAEERGRSPRLAALPSMVTRVPGGRKGC
mmetsp:Transcript_15219/g.40136  ORF Transcript_15219/g.40136 Transcript_15219/m.40136 type:complete len:266 (-) Transcript_15219:154-951(-)